MTTAVCVAAVALAGLVVRAIPVALADFPVNDGGLFVAMTRGIEDAGWGLPVSISWNGSELPFAYPPLGFYLSGGISSMFGVDLTDVFRWLPLVASALVVPAVFLLGRELLRSDLGALVAALAYALAPASYVWLVQGGGVTRSPGMLLAVLTIWQVVRLVRDPGRRTAIVVGVLAGLTALVHPGAAIFAAVSAVLIWIFEGRTAGALRAGGVSVVIALLIAAPWLAITISRHGLDALLGVPSNGPEPVAALLAILAGRVTGTASFDPLAIAGLVVAIVWLVRRQFLLPIWFGVATLLSYQYGMVPFGMLIGSAAVLLASRMTPSTAGAARAAPLVSLGILGAALVFEAGASVLAVQNPGAPLHALGPERREAMAWVDANLEPEAELAVITNSVWSGDPDSEWFYLLAARRSVATVQGSEWLGEAAFEDQVQANRALQGCNDLASVSCVEDWLAEWGGDYVYLPKGPIHGPGGPQDCCADLRQLLSGADGFTPVYDGPGATILAWSAP
jgi:hypothetical protein